MSNSYDYIEGLQTLGLFQYSPCATLLIDDSETIVYANPAALALFNYPDKKQLLYQPFADSIVFFTDTKEEPKHLRAQHVLLHCNHRIIKQATCTCTPAILPGLSQITLTDIDEELVKPTTLTHFADILKTRPLLQSLFELVRLEIAIFTPDHRYVYISPASITNIEVRNWLLGKDDYDYCASRNVPTTMADIRRAAFQQVIDTRDKHTYIDTVTKPTGEKDYILRCMAPLIVDNEIICVVGYAINKTDVYKSETLRQNNELFYKFILDALPVAISIKNKEEVYKFKNKAYQTLCLRLSKNIAQDEGACKKLSAAKGLEKEKEVWTLPENTIYFDHNKPVEIDYESCYFDQRKLVTTDAHGEALLLDFTLETTALVRAEQAKDNANNLTKMLIQSALDAIVQTDETGKIVSWNQQFQSLFGYKDETEEDIRNLYLPDLIFVNKQRDTTTEKEHLNSGKEKLYFLTMQKLQELKGIHKNGTIIEIEVYFTKLTDSNNQPIFSAFIRNITDRKRAEIELRTAFDIVREQNKRLLNFSYIISHNLRSHSSNIEGLLNLFVSSKSEDQRNMIIGHLQKTAVMLGETIVHLNDVVAIQSSLDVKKTMLNLKHYINNALEIATKNHSNKRISIECEVPESLNINYNAAYLESILLNLLTNALKYNHPDRQPVIKISTYYENDWVVLAVQDNGIGINLQMYGNQLFGMYKTFHGNKDAKGLGLFITKNQIEALGSKITVESEPGIGSIFRISLCPAN